MKLMMNNTIMIKNKQVLNDFVPIGKMHTFYFSIFLLYLFIGVLTHTAPKCYAISTNDIFNQIQFIKQTYEPELNEDLKSLVKKKNNLDRIIHSIKFIPPETKKPVWSDREMQYLRKLNDYYLGMKVSIQYHVDRTLDGFYRTHCSPQQFSVSDKWCKTTALKLGKITVDPPPQAQSMPIEKKVQNFC